MCGRCAGARAGGSAAFRTAGEGHISAGAVDKDVAFVEVHDVDDEVDDAYRSKYGGRYPASYVDPMVSPDVRATTLKLVPR